MANWYLIRFRTAGDLFRISSDKDDIKTGDNVIVKTHRGREFGCVVRIASQISDNLQIAEAQSKIDHLVDEKDIEREHANRDKEREAFDVCNREIKRLNIDMSLIRVHYLFDRSRVIFYFKAAGKVDFRELVRSLASIFRTRIEMKQIGVRDEAKLLGGFGPCGRPCCCGSWLPDFESVVIKMAKVQNLSLNPSKISGLCGRLMCCLGYEQEHYEKVLKGLPYPGSEIIYKDEPVRLTSVNVIKEEASILVPEKDSFKVVKISLEELRECKVSKKPEKRNSRHSRPESSSKTGSDKNSNSNQDNKNTQTKKQNNNKINTCSSLGCPSCKDGCAKVKEANQT